MASPYARSKHPGYFLYYSVPPGLMHNSSVIPGLSDHSIVLGEVKRRPQLTQQAHVTSLLVNQFIEKASTRAEFPWINTERHRLMRKRECTDTGPDQSDMMTRRKF